MHKNYRNLVKHAKRSDASMHELEFYKRINRPVTTTLMAVSRA